MTYPFVWRLCRLETMGFFLQTHNVYLHHTHYARTFNVLGQVLRIKATLVVRITRRVWKKKKNLIYSICALHAASLMLTWI